MSLTWSEMTFPFITCPFNIQFSSVQSLSCVQLWRHELQHARPPCPSPTPRVYPNSCPSSQWCHPAISSSVSPSPPVPNPSQHWSLFQWVNSSHEVAKVLEFQLQHQSFQRTPRTHHPLGWTGWISLQSSYQHLKGSFPLFTTHLVFPVEHFNVVKPVQ